MENFKNYNTMTIGSCSEANKLGNGRFFKSDRFNAGGHSWRIAFHPNGRLAGTTASMSLFLLLDDADDNSDAAAADEDVVHVKFRFMMHEVCDYAPVFMSSTVTAGFTRRCNAHGFERFVSREDFDKTGRFVKLDRFAIQCRLTVFPVGSKPAAAVQMSRSATAVQAAPPPAGSLKPTVVPATPSASAPPLPTPSVVKPRVPPAASPELSVVTAVPPPLPKPLSIPAGGQRDMASPLSGLPADLGRLLATKEASDVDLEVRGKVFAAHKSVLAARSPVFMEELFGPAKEEDTGYVCIIPDMRPEAFEALLHYPYTDMLPPKMAMNSLEDGVMLAEDLLAAADRYELKDLKMLTENKLCSHVGVSTVLPMLALAERHQCCKLKKMCLEFIGSCRNTSAVMATNGLEVLARSSPSVVKDVITEILDASEARRRCLINIFAFCFVLPFLLFVIFS